MYFSASNKVLLILLCIAFYGIARLHHAPPAPLSQDVSPAHYSAERAFTHVTQIAATPHPAGSDRATEVRDYIVGQIKSLGLVPQVQEAVIYRKPATFASVQNVVVRLEGASDTPDAIALMAHYDSVVFGPGAADDTSGVAALLETMRALSHTPPLQHDIIFVFTDGEEGRAFGGTGLRGAYAFVEKHPWANDVRVVINFDARGTAGQSYMYQTSGKNAWLIKALKQSGCKAATTSLGYEVYSRMPVGSDLSAFIDAEIPGYDCAFIQGLEKYHTMLDSPEHLSLASLQHNGEYALTLTRHLADQPLEDARDVTENLVYFDFPWVTLIHYSNSTATALMLLVLLLYFAIVLLGIRRNEMQLKKLLCAAACYLAWFAFCCVSGIGAMLLGYHFRNIYILYSSDALSAGLILILSGLSILVLNRMMNRLGVSNVIYGILLPWVAACSLSLFYMPGATYVFTWPLLLTLGATGINILWRRNLENMSTVNVLLLAPAAFITILFMVGVFQGFYAALMFIFIPLHIAVVLFALTLLAPHIRLLTGNREKVVPLMLTILGLIFLGTGIFWPGFSAEQPKFNSITYGLNADTGQALYMSCDEEVDSWTAQFLGDDPQRMPITDFIPIAQKDYLQSPAPSLSLAPPTVDVLEDTTSSGKRMLHLRIDSPRKAEVIEIYALGDTRITSAIVNDIPMEITTHPWRLSYSIYRGQGIDLRLESAVDKTVQLRVSDHKYYLESMLDFRPRPPAFIPKPNTVDFNRDPLKSEESIVTGIFEFPQEQQL